MYYDLSYRRRNIWCLIGWKGVHKSFIQCNKSSANKYRKFIMAGIIQRLKISEFAANRVGCIIRITKKVFCLVCKTKFGSTKVRIHLRTSKNKVACKPGFSRHMQCNGFIMECFYFEIHLEKFGFEEKRISQIRWWRTKMLFKNLKHRYCQVKDSKELYQVKSMLE